MSLKALETNKRTSIDSAVAGMVDGRRFGAALRQLEAFDFWTPSGNGKRRPLWEHQRTAIVSAQSRELPRKQNFLARDFRWISADVLQSVPPETLQSRHDDQYKPDKSHFS